MKTPPISSRDGQKTSSVNGGTRAETTDLVLGNVESHPVGSGHVGPGPIAPAPTLELPKRRRRPALIAAGVILVILGALGSYYLAQQSAERIAVVGMAKDVAWGEKITSSDLIQVQIVDDPSLLPIRWSDASDLVGQVAASDLQAGTLITSKSVTSLEIPGAGNALVGVAVAAGQIPVTPLQPQDQVLLVATPKSGGGEDTTTAAPVEAMVYAVGPVQSNGKQTVDVIVSQDKAGLIAAQSADGSIAIVLVPNK